jgi:hypothetical protein
MSMKMSAGTLVSANAIAVLGFYGVVSNLCYELAHDLKGHCYLLQ